MVNDLPGFCTSVSGRRVVRPGLAVGAATTLLGSLSPVNRTARGLLDYESEMTDSRADAGQARSEPGQSLPREAREHCQRIGSAVPSGGPSRQSSVRLGCAPELQAELRRARTYGTCSPAPSRQLAPRSPLWQPWGILDGDTTVTAPTICRARRSR